MSNHTGQGFAVSVGAAYSAPDRDGLARRAALREASEHESRIESLSATEEAERRTLALAAGWQAVVRTYRSLGGAQALSGIAWCPEPDADEDPFAGIDGSVERPA